MTRARSRCSRARRASYAASAVLRLRIELGEYTAVAPILDRRVPKDAVAQLVFCVSPSPLADAPRGNAGLLGCKRDTAGAPGYAANLKDTACRYGRAGLHGTKVVS